MKPDALVCLLFALLAGLPLVGPLAAQADPKHAQSIETLSPFTKAETADRVAAGLVEAGYVLDRVDGTTIIPAVRMVRNVSEAHVRVNLLGSGDSTRVVTSATYDIPTLGLKNEPAEANRSARGAAASVAGPHSLQVRSITSPASCAASRPICVFAAR